MSKSADIAVRLKAFGQSHFGTDHGWKKRFADALGVTTQHLDRYLSGASEPGNKMYMRLIHLGCDIQWLLTGKHTTDQTLFSAEERAILQALRNAGIDTIEKVHYLLDAEHLAADIAAAAVKEIQSKYQTKKPPRRKRS